MFTAKSLNAKLKLFTPKINKRDSTFMIHPKYFNYKISTDSIRYRIPLTDKLLEAVETKFIRDFVAQKHASGTIDPEYKMRKFQMITVDQIKRLPSNVNALTCSLERGEQYLQFYYSIPKVMYGHSAFMFEYPFAHLESVRLYLQRILGEEVPPIEQWLLLRWDVPYNFELSSLKDVQKATKYLSKLRVYGKRGLIDKKGNLIPYWKSSRITRKFYSKHDDMMRPSEQKKYGEQILRPELTTYAESLLRYEEEWHQEGLKRKLSVKSAEQVTVGRFMYYVKTFYNQEDHINKVMEKFTLVERKTNIVDIMSKIDTMKRPTNYRNFVLQIISDGLDVVKSRVKSSTYYDRVGKLRELGIDVELIHNDYHDNMGETPDDINLVISPDNLQTITTEDAFEVNDSFGVVAFPGERERLRREFKKELSRIQKTRRQNNDYWDVMH